MPIPTDVVPNSAAQHLGIDFLQTLDFAKQIIECGDWNVDYSSKGAFFISHRCLPLLKNGVVFIRQNGILFLSESRTSIDVNPGKMVLGSLDSGNLFTNWIQHYKLAL